MKYRGSSRHWLVIMLQGPSRPWWLSPVLVWFGVAMLLFGLKLWGGHWLAGLFVPVGAVSAAAGAVWWRMRTAEWHHYRRFALEERWDECPRCSYSLDGIQPERCPECGEDLHRLRRVLSQRRSEWF